MEKYKVIVLAKEMNMKVPELIKMLKEQCKIEAKNAMSYIEITSIDWLKEQQLNFQKVANQKIQRQEEAKRLVQPKNINTVNVSEVDTKPTSGAKPKAKTPSKGKEKDHFFNEDGNIEKLASGNNEKQYDVAKELEYDAVQGLTVSELSKNINVPTSEIVKKLFLLGIIATTNNTIDRDAIEIIAEEFGFEIKEIVHVDDSDINNYDFEDEEKNLVERPPVVTIMGHVDHGKTSLLDYIRNENVASGESGGITQHIGAYQIQHNGKAITFLDTPGHEAFTQMRIRGAEITDICILVVAADDSIKEQTLEAIDHARSANVPIIVAITKIDKETANAEKVMTDLSNHDLVPEKWGGKTIYVETSSETGKGIDDLLDMILLNSEMLELKANPNRRAYGHVIEAKQEKGKGSVATLLVEKGTLKVGNSIVVGHTWGRVRTMTDEYGKSLKECGPSYPVEITGINDTPRAGDSFVVFEKDKEARSVGEIIKNKYSILARRENSKHSVDALFEKIKEQGFKNVNVVIKADTQGSVEAINKLLQRLEYENVRIGIVRSAVGAISESDILLASASQAIIIGFNVRPDNKTKEIADNNDVTIRTYTIIYKIVEEMEQILHGHLETEFIETSLGFAEIRKIFKFSKVGSIAGAHVTSGKITRSAKINLLRDGIIIFQGELSSLKHQQDDVKERPEGSECGFTLKNYNDIKEGDVIEAYELNEKSIAQRLEEIKKNKNKEDAKAESIEANEQAADVDAIKEDE